MRILVIHSRYRTGAVSGENRVVEDEVRLLREQGHTVALLEPSAHWPGASRRELVGAGLNAVWSRSAVRLVREAIAADDWEIVHLHNPFPHVSPAVIRGAADAGSAVVMTLHNFRLVCIAATFLRDGAVCEDCLGRGPWRGVEHRCYRNSLAGSGALAASLSVHRRLKTFSAVHEYAAVSAFVRGKIAQGGIDASRISVKHNFVYGGQLRVGAGDYFLSMGRLSPEKGLDEIVRLWRFPLPLLIVGDGPERRRLQRLAGPNVEFTGRVSPDEVERLLTRARALLFPSRCYEGSPRAVLEALAVGVPVVAAEHGGLPEHVEHEESGLLVGVGDRNGWRDAIEQLSDASEAIRLGQGAYGSWRARFSPGPAHEALVRVYQRAMVRAGRASVRQAAEDRDGAARAAVPAGEQLGHLARPAK